MIPTHIFDTDEQGLIFSRDCCEYHFLTPSGASLVLLINHVKSKGFSTPGDKTGARKRARQAKRVAEIYQGLQGPGVDLIAVIGDFNDSPDSDALARPSSPRTDMRDISTHPAFDFGSRKGTFGGGFRHSRTF